MISHILYSCASGAVIIILRKMYLGFVCNYLDILNNRVYITDKRIVCTYIKDKNMIQEFTVENFRSIKAKQTLSFLASNKIQNGAEEYLYTQVNDSVRLLKLCVLYGYNASGKTNLLRGTWVSTYYCSFCP